MSEARSITELKKGIAIGTDTAVLFTKDATTEQMDELAKILGWDEYEVTEDGAGYKMRPTTEDDDGH